MVEPEYTSVDEKERVSLVPIIYPERQALLPTRLIAGQQMLTNIALETAHGKALVMQAGNPADLQPDEFGCVRLRCTHFLIYPDSGMDEETGEVRDYTRTVLYDVSGRHFRTTAAHAQQRLAVAFGLYSEEEWAKGIPLVIRSRTGKRGRVYHDIRIDVEAK